MGNQESQQGGGGGGGGGGNDDDDLFLKDTMLILGGTKHVRRDIERGTR